MIEKEHINYILKEAKRAVINKDIFALKDLSNRTIHAASIYQDINSILIAVTIYSLSKIISVQMLEHANCESKFLRKIASNIDQSIKKLNQNKTAEFHQFLVNTRHILEQMDPGMKKYVGEVFRKAYINKASKIYEHGISAAETSKILGISQWELNEYLGFLGTPSQNVESLSINQRIKFAENLFT